MVPHEQFASTLMREGNLSQYDAGKVANFFSNRGVINVAKFEEYLRQALNLQAVNSQAVQKFQRIVQGSVSGEALAR